MGGKQGEGGEEFGYSEVLARQPVQSGHRSKRRTQPFENIEKFVYREPQTCDRHQNRVAVPKLFVRLVLDCEYSKYVCREKRPRETGYVYSEN